MAQHLPAPDVSSLAVPADEPTSPGGRIAPQLLGGRGQVQVWVQLQDEPLAVAAANAESTGLPLTGDAQRALLAALQGKHDDLSFDAESLGGRELGRVSKSQNAVAFEIEAAQLPALAAHPGVVTVRPVIDYSVELSETVPYIGATAVQNLGVTGKGVRVAVLDTGIDYTHRNMKGSGTAADYTAAFGTSLDDPRNKTVNPALFPTDKVVGGFDFIGEHWPQPDGRPVADGGCGRNSAGVALVCLRPDPNPIACGGVGGCDGTHGTHVADIIGGLSKDGKHKGVAPGTQLYAVKVCSSVSSSCSGVALMQAMDFALDPNGDGDISDHVDVINMSLGSNYGQKEDDLTQASENAVRAGVVVATAGDGGGERGGQAVHRQLAQHRARRDQRGAVAGAERQVLPAGRQLARSHRRQVHQHRLGRLGADRERVHRKRRHRRPRLPGGYLPGQPGGEGGVDRPRLLRHQPEGRSGRQGGRHRRRHRARGGGRCDQLLLRRRDADGPDARRHPGRREAHQGRRATGQRHREGLVARASATRPSSRRSARPALPSPRWRGRARARPPSAAPPVRPR